MTSPVRVRSQRGFALPSAIITLVLLSTLVVGVLFVATEELRAGRSDVADQRALALAEWGVEETIRRWDSQQNTTLAVGTTVAAALPATIGGDRVDVTVTRVQQRAVWIVARSAVSDGRAIPARRTIGVSLRLVGPSVPLRAALTSGGAVTVRDGGMVSGYDVTPPGSHSGLCAEALPEVAGIVAPDSTRVCGSECTGTVPEGVVGMPPIGIGGAQGSESTLASPRDTVPESFTSGATYTLEAGTITARPLVAGDVCDITNAFNWGDPGGASPCAHHFPVVWVRGSAVLAAGSVGQGILLVDGDLQLEPGARFVGVVIAADDIIVRGPGAEIVGVALARDADSADGTLVADGGTIWFSSCGAQVALLGAARLAHTPSRWWAELR
jgi:Tfp pilus assembly protein PilV